MLGRLIQAVSQRARNSRAQLFRETFEVGPETRILDLGGNSGGHIAKVLEGLDYSPANVTIADVLPEPLAKARERGFRAVQLDGPVLPFEDHEFDIVFCSSVIEHVTPEEARGKPGFRSRAMRLQEGFAAEIRRVAVRYWVQTPNRWFPVESHLLLPFVGYMTHRSACRATKFAKRFWIRRTVPYPSDVNLLAARDMERLFPEGRIIRESFAGLTKSLVAAH